MLLPIIAFLSIPVWSQTLPVFDADFTCLTDSQAQTMVNDFHIDVQSFGGVELCNGDVDSKKLFNDLTVVKDGTFRSDNVFIKDLLTTSYYDFLKKNTYGVRRKNDVPTATAYNQKGYFTMQDGWTQLSTLGRVGTIIHEARHTEGYRHVVCNQGPYKMTFVSGCDSDYAYGGSHAVEMEYYAKVVVRGENFHPLYKKMARLMGLARSNFVFNTPVIQRREALLVRTEKNHGFLVNSKLEVVPRELPESPGHLKTSSSGGVLFEGSRAWALDLYSKDHATDLISDAYSYFKLLKDNDSPKNLKEFDELDKGGLRFVIGLNQNNEYGFFEFKDGNWTSFVSSGLNVEKTLTSNAQGETGLFFVDNNHKAHKMNLIDRTVDPVGSDLAVDDVAYTQAFENSFRLDSQGKVFIRAKDTDFWTEVPVSGEKIVEMITVPLYDAYEVEL